MTLLSRACVSPY